MRFYENGCLHLSGLYALLVGLDGCLVENKRIGWEFEGIVGLKLIINKHKYELVSKE